MYDMIIIGAGLAGSSFASVLAGLGWNVLLAERQRLSHHKVCGEFLSPEVQASLWAMDLYDTVAALTPSHMRHARLVSPLGAELRVGLPGAAWGVSRYALDQTLATAAAQRGAEVRTGVTVTGVTATASGYDVVLRGPEGETTVQSRAVVAACGRHTVPALRPQRPPHSRPTSVGVKCHYEGVTMPSQVDLFLFDGGYAGLSPIEDGRYNLCLLASSTAFKQAGSSIRGMLDAAARLNPALARQLAGSRPLVETEVAVAPVDTGVLGVPWDGMARLGDAAVMIPPLCGDGMAMALRAAEICAPLAHSFLQGRLSQQEWAAAYRTAWHAEFDRPVHTGRQLQTLLGTPLLVDGLLGMGNYLPLVASYLVKATRGRLRPLETVPRLLAAAGQ